MFDLDKAKSCTSKMKNYFNSTEEISSVEIPDNIKIDSNEYIYYIFYSCLLDLWYAFKNLSCQFN